MRFSYTFQIYLLLIFNFSLFNCDNVEVSYTDYLYDDPNKCTLIHDDAGKVIYI